MPKYYVVKKYIIDNINDETFNVNAVIPSERELMDKFNMSRITVRKAIEDLVNEGYLYKIQGKGTYVKSDEFKQNLFSITGCTEDIKKLGMTPSKKLIYQGVEKADKKRLRRLNLIEGDLVLKIIRVYYADSEPINYTITHLPLKLFPDIDKLDFSVHSIYDVIENKYLTKITTATRTLEAVTVFDNVRENLNMKAGSPALLFRSVTFGRTAFGELPIETFKCYYRSDKFKFYINQVR
ncbi:MAG: GntR family transcriptional regulator [Oscillospiraceae bacterium]